MSDIVTRLRETATEERPLWRSQMLEAADEIERLRNEMADWQRTVRALEEQLSSYRGRY